MAGPITEKQLAHQVYDSLQASSCPLVEGLYLQEDDSMLELLCSPSELRTDILTWICCSINPNFVSSKDASVKSKDPDALTKEIAAFGQELMLSKMNDLDLIKGKASPLRQLRFLEQLLTLVPGCKKSAGNRTDGEALLNELFAAENLQNLTHMLRPSLDPWPAQIKALRKGTKPSYKPREEFADVSAVLQSTQTEFKELQSKCDFLKDGAALSVFSPSSLRLSACDLQQLMTTFSHVFDTDMKPYCSREPPSFSADTDIFQRVHQRLLACNTELEMLKEASEASASMRDEVEQLQTQPLYWSRGEKHTLPDQLEETSQQIRNFLSQLDS
ncbi:HAUS augmin-like complex subunit 7 [Kryptolebias marmoratus]|uniref:HAUS augmin like complex subunit 7 n=1 Tax=Kryptolebias marmoratus TaxID=37003 RepID=A0A3Q3A7M4_KRYMA|nr:HAUS augmin-like complex subunit 7 [Kryptolebias marmoratus]